MTTHQEGVREGIEAMGLVMQLQVADAQWTQNMLEDMFCERIREYKKAFVDLFDAVEAVGEQLDSKKIDRVLSLFDFQRASAERKEWWEKNS